MKNKFFILLILLNCTVYGQDSVTENKFCIKIAPLSLLDIYSGMSPRIGIEYKLKRNFALYNEIGTYIPNANGMHNNTGYLAKLEFKTYLNKSNLTSGPYLSAEVFYKHQSYGTYDSIYIVPDKYLQNYQVTKDVTCFTVKIGALGLLDNGLVLDPFVGLGIRNRIISSSLTKEENDNIQQDGNRINVIKNKAGVFNVLNFDMGIKIGYRIK